MQLTVYQQLSDDAVLARVNGEIDMSTAEQFSSSLMTALNAASAHPARLLIVDLNGVDFFGSTGLNAVLQCHRCGLNASTAVRLVASTPLVVRPIEVTKLDGILALYPSVAAARRSGDPDLQR